MKSFKLFLRVLCHKPFSLLNVIPITILIVALVAVSCQTTKNSVLQNPSVEMISDNDSTEYSLLVLDPGYEFYLASQPSANFYSQQYYESWNKRYVMEWNARHRNPLQYGGFYETEINYDTTQDYGLNLNYRLYYYFLFIKGKYGIRLIDRGR